MTKLQLLAIKQVKELSNEVAEILLQRNADMGQWAHRGSAFNEINTRLSQINYWTEAVLESK